MQGLFSAPDFLFPGNCQSASESELLQYSPLVIAGDLLSDKVTIKGTNYQVGNIVVTKVVSCNVLEVGTIIRVVLRKDVVLFLVLESHAARVPIGFFEALPTNTAGLVRYDQLADYKPLIKRGANECYSFVLHHHIPVDQ